MAEQALGRPGGRPLARSEEVQGVNLDVDYERRDVSPKLLGILGLSLFVVVAGSAAGLGYLYPPGSTSMLRQVPPATPPGLPRLQVDPAADLAALRLTAEMQLGSYGWVDKAAGIAHVPIEEAMHRVAQQGIPDWNGAAR